MVRDPLFEEDPPDLQSVLEALDDADCRTIIRHLDRPMTANEVSTVCDIPVSTTYRKLDRLADASLLAAGTDIRADGHHATRYEIDFESVLIDLVENRDLEVSIARPAGGPDEQLARLWAEVRRGT